MFYGACALFVALWLWHSAVLPMVKEGATTAVSVDEKQCLEPEAEQKSMLGLIVDFFTKFPVKETVIGILFMLLYRMPEGLLAKVSALFLVDNTAVGGWGAGRLIDWWFGTYCRAVWFGARYRWRYRTNPWRYYWWYLRWCWWLKEMVVANGLRHHFA